ncbi:MAG: phosphate ABC transporter substrate-binding protein [Planctomycetota bacterium]
MARTRIVALLLLAVFAGGCGVGDAAAASGARLVLTGSSTVAPLAAEIGKRFEELNPPARVDVQTGGSSRGIADAKSGAADIGMASRALKDGEEGLTVFPLARDGVALIVHADNPVRELSRDEVTGVFTGRIQRWSELGGPDSEITVVNKAEGRATLEVFLAHFGLDNREVQADVVIGDNEQGVKTVAGNRSAIGYVSVGTAELDIALGVPIRLLPAGGVEASTENVANGTFPIARQLSLLTPGEPSGLAREFLTFAQSEEVHDLIAQQGFAPIAR